MGQVLAQKLSVTAALLGCATRKELCARFRAVNPATEFDLPQLQVAAGTRAAAVVAGL
jgi:hypothetical protein